ncbi:MAG TPA: alkaline phosphatase family protein [Solirubrobacteraceae bacterium]
MASPKKLILCVIDAMAPAMLQRTIEQGAAPVLARLIERGELVNDCVAAFPSVTPVCAASIVTGARQDRHQIPGMNWYHREEQRYVEYGSSFRSAQRFGIARQLTDTVYNMNRAHLAAEPTTIFERLDDVDVRTAGTTYLMYRGRHRHEPQRDTTLAKIAASTLMRHPVLGPRELFYADIFASQRTPCRSTLGMPGIRDRHSGCVGAYLVENDLFDFMLFSLPDNDWLSHKHGPEAQVRSIAAADLQLARMMAPAGGVDAFLEDHAVIVMADHSQAPISEVVCLQDELAELRVLGPGGRLYEGGRQNDVGRSLGNGDRPQIAVCPSQRAAMIYVLEEEQRDALRPGIVRRCLELPGVELAAWLERDANGTPREGAVRTALGELRFAPADGQGEAMRGETLPGGRDGALRGAWTAPGGSGGSGDVEDLRGVRWSIEGDLGTVGGSVEDGLLLTPSHPDVLARLYAALICPTSGDVLLSAAAGCEFTDWGGQAHVGGGSHGSLRAEDSLCPVLGCGLGEALQREGERGPRPLGIHDVVPPIERFFGLA